MANTTITTITTRPTISTNMPTRAAGTRLTAGMTPEAISAAQSRFAARVQRGDLGHGIAGHAPFV
jgi:hypothetical protein